MGCPGATRSVFTRAFRVKREFQCIFLWKKAIVITSKHGTTIFFSHYNLFLGKLKEKLARKARINTDASMWDRAHAPWASHNTNFIQLIQYGRRIGKKVYCTEKQPTFREATTSFPSKWHLRKEYRNFILMTRHYSDPDSTSDWLKQNFSQSEALPRPQ